MKIRGNIVNNHSLHIESDGSWSTLFIAALFRKTLAFRYHILPDVLQNEYFRKFFIDFNLFITFSILHVYARKKIGSLETMSVLNVTLVQINFITFSGSAELAYYHVRVRMLLLNKLIPYIVLGEETLEVVNPFQGSLFTDSKLTWIDHIIQLSGLSAKDIGSLLS